MGRCNTTERFACMRAWSKGAVDVRNTQQQPTWSVQTRSKFSTLSWLLQLGLKGDFTCTET